MGDKMNDKDQAAIDQVASVSKHPHAAMIVKWLITGWDVKRKDRETVLPQPYWHIDVEYELIEPKPVKPAYRVYSDQDGDLFVAERNPDGGVCQTFTEGCEWISPDWIEYGPPKKWPTPLVERIAAIDIKAAQWIVDHWDDLLDEKYTMHGQYSRDRNRLIEMFSWNISGPNFNWYDISDKLGE